jgi:hypothetical protein
MEIGEEAHHLLPCGVNPQTYSENNELYGRDRFEGDPIAQPLNSPCELVDEMGLSTVIKVMGPHKHVKELW